MSPATGKPVPPMLATLGHPPTGERWAWESKWDGMRAIATTGTEKPELWSRNGNRVSESFPEILEALAAVLGHRETVLDGEIVALDKGVPSFAKLQRRMHVRKPTTQLQNSALTTYYVFDVLDIDGTSTTELTYLERREALDSLSIENPRIKVPPFCSMSMAPPCSKSRKSITSKGSSRKVSTRRTSRGNVLRTG